MTAPSRLPIPPYYAVVFTSLRGGEDPVYDTMAARMAKIALDFDGCLGMDTARGADGLGITVSYWRDAASIKAWKADARHMVAQQLGAREWYSAYTIQVARVERRYAGPREIPSDDP